MPLAQRIAWALLGATLSFAAQASGQSWQLITTLDNDTAWRTRSPRVIQKSQSRLWLDLELELTPTLGIRGIGRAVWDPVRRIWSSDPIVDQKAVERWQVSSELEVELRELYVDWRDRVGGARLDLRVGKQQIVWGHSFGLRVLDFVDPRDFREFLLEPFVESRIPTTGARLEVTLPRFSFEAIVIPDFESDVIPDPTSEFALDQQLPGFLPPLFEVPAGGFLVDVRGSDTPDDWSLDTLGFGFRGATVAGGFDLALYYWDRYDSRPAFSRRLRSVNVPGLGVLPLNEIRAEHFRVRSLGLSFSTAWQDFTFWGEGVASHGVRFVTDDLLDADGLEKKPEVQYALGVDWTGVDHLFANLQFLQFVVLDHQSEIEVDQFRSYASLLLRADFRNETVFPQLFVMYGSNEQDLMIRPSLEWSVNDHLSLSLGADLFTGPREGLFGQYARRRQCLPVPTGAPVPQAGGCAFEPPPGRSSRIYLQLRYSFSLGG